MSKVKSDVKTMEYVFVEECPENTILVETEAKPIPPKPVQNVRQPTEILSKPELISPKITPRRMVFQSSKNSLPLKIFPRPQSYTFYDESLIEKFSKAWRCTLCKKISSTKKVCMEHLKVYHPKNCRQ